MIIGFGSNNYQIQWQILILYCDILDNYALQTLCQEFHDNAEIETILIFFTKSGAEGLY